MGGLWCWWRGKLLTYCRKTPYRKSLKFKEMFVSLSDLSACLCWWSVRWEWGLFGAVLKCSWSCLRSGVGNDYSDLAEIHRQWWLFVGICFVIKKLISTGSSQSLSLSLPLCLLRLLRPHCTQMLQVNLSKLTQSDFFPLGAIHGLLYVMHLLYSYNSRRQKAGFCNVWSGF